VSSVQEFAASTGSACQSLFFVTRGAKPYWLAIHSNVSRSFCGAQALGSARCPAQLLVLGHGFAATLFMSGGSHSVALNAIGCAVVRDSDEVT
jgi:hypothetical protein